MDGPRDAGGRPDDGLAGRASAHLILVGPPGAGKTTTGRRVARQLGVPFLDLDAEIERAEGMAVAAIFATHGEPYFRALEREATLALRERPPMIVAPGGGWIIDPANAALLRPPGRILYLRASPTTAVRRMGMGVHRRPLLAGPDPVAALAALLRRREAAYATADLIVETDRRSQQQIAAAVREAAATLWGALHDSD